MVENVVILVTVYTLFKQTEIGIYILENRALHKIYVTPIGK